MQINLFSIYIVSYTDMQGNLLANFTKKNNSVEELKDFLHIF